MLRHVLKSCRCFSSYPSHEILSMPALSPTMTHGTLSSWKMKEGETVLAGEVVAEIETDKAVVDYEAQDEMILAKCLVKAGTSDIPVGHPIMIMVEDAMDVSAFVDYEAPEIIQEGEVPVLPSDFLVQPQVEKTVPAPIAKVTTPPTVTTPVLVPIAATSMTTSSSGFTAYLQKKQEEYRARYG